jgi:hypothetical protein
MHVIIVNAAALILLGIVIFSVHSGSNNGTISDNKGIIQKIENNSSFPEASKDWSGFKAVTVNSDNSGNLQLMKIQRQIFQRLVRLAYLKK